MNFIKKNVSLLGILAGFLVLLAASLFLLNQKVREGRRVEEGLGQMIEQRRALWNRKPFPSAENVDLVRKHAEEEILLVEEGLKILREGSLSCERMPGSQCKALILDARRRMSDLLNRNGIVFPAKFQFGFERYDVRPPDDEDTPMIQKQLRIVEEFVKLIAEARFQEVVTVRRVEFEGNRLKSEAKSDAPKARSVSIPDPLISSDGGFDFIDSPAHIYTVMPFELEVLGDTDAFRSFLDALARSSFVLIPRIFSIENEKQEPMTGKEVAAGGAESARRGAPKAKTPPPSRAGIPSPTASGAPQTDPSDLPFVLGEEKVKIGMRIEWFEFRCKPEGKQKP